MLLVQHELDFYRKYVGIVAHLVTKSFNDGQACRVFLRRNEDLRRWQGCKCFVDMFHIFGGKLMMVVKRERMDTVRDWSEVMNQLLRRGYACQQ